MENQNSNNVAISEQEEGLDIMALVRSLWVGRKTVIICTSIFFVLGLVAALTMKRTYMVNTVMVPQLNSKSNSPLSSLATLAGFDMGMVTGGSELSPLVYPHIVSSVPYRLELMHTPLHFEKCDTMISLYNYVRDGYAKPSVFDVVLKYTIGLPGVIINSFRGKQPEVVLPGGGSGASNTPKPVVVSVGEQKMMEVISKMVTLNVDKKEGYLTLTVMGSEPIQTAELAMKAQQLLQDEITRFRVEKSASELEYIQARYDEIKREADSYQVMMATATDRTQNVATTRALVEKERIQTKYSISKAVFTEMAKQLEQAKMQVKKDTPVFAVVQPVSVPMKPANSRAMKLFIWTFLGIMLGCGIVLGKEYWPKVKEKFQKQDEE